MLGYTFRGSRRLLKEDRWFRQWPILLSRFKHGASIRGCGCEIHRLHANTLEVVVDSARIGRPTPRRAPDFVDLSG